LESIQDFPLRSDGLSIILAGAAPVDCQ
jgi:hypothetical protein